MIDRSRADGGKRRVARLQALVHGVEEAHQRRSGQSQHNLDVGAEEDLEERKVALRELGVRHDVVEGDGQDHLQRDFKSSIQRRVIVELEDAEADVVPRERRDQDVQREREALIFLLVDLSLWDCDE